MTQAFEPNPTDTPSVRPADRRLAGVRLVLRVTLAAVVLGIGLHALTTAVIDYRLDRKVQALRDTGEPMLPEDLHTSIVPDDQNAVADVNIALRLMSEENGGTDLDAFARFDDDGMLLPLALHEQETLLNVLSEYPQTLSAVRYMTTKPSADWGLRWETPVVQYLTPGLRPNMDLGVLVQAAAVGAYACGNHHAAVEYLLYLNRLAEVHEAHPALAGHLVAMGMESRMAATAWEIGPSLRIGLAPGQADPQLVRRLIEVLLDDTPVRQGLARGLRGERVMAYDMLRLATDAGPDAMALTTPSAAGFSLNTYLVKPVVLGDTIATIDHYTGLVALAELPDWKTAQSAIPRTLTDAHGRGDSAFDVSRQFVRSLDAVVMFTFRVMSERRLAATALAVQLYLAENRGEFPASIAMLVPAYLPSVPMDALDGEPIRYRPPPVVPVIYGVGDDGQDDGGKEASAGAGATGPLETGFDRVVHLTPRVQPLPTKPR